MYVGLKFMQRFGPEYFWKSAEMKYYRVCTDFDLERLRQFVETMENRSWR